MNFLKGLFGVRPEPTPEERVLSFSCRCTLNRLANSKLVPLQPDCLLRFVNREGLWTILCQGKDQQWTFRVHREMDMVRYCKDDRIVYEWLQEPTTQLGKRNFLQVVLTQGKEEEELGQVLGAVLGFQKQKGSLSFKNRSPVRKLDDCPDYEGELKQLMSKALLRLAQFQSTKLVNSCSLYSSNQNGQFELEGKQCILLVTESKDFVYEGYVLTAGYSPGSKELFCEGTVVLSYFPVKLGLSYECSKSGNYFKYFDRWGSTPTIRVLRFDGYGVAMQLQLMIVQLGWQAQHRQEMEKAISQEEKEEYDYPDIEEEEAAIKELAHSLENVKIVQTALESTEYKELPLTGAATEFRIRDICQLKRSEAALVTHGPVVEVYADKKGVFQKVTELRGLQTADRKVVPSRILPLKGQSRAFVLDHQNPRDGFYFDISKERIISEFKNVLDQPILAIAHKCQGDELQEAQTFYGVTSQDICMFDPRTEKCLAFSKHYKTSTGFSAVGSTGDGTFAVGDQMGNIRLYKEAGQQAKNKYKGSREAVEHIECSKDGTLVLATFQTHLLLIPSADEEMGDAFRERVPVSKRITPKRLRLRVEDLGKVKSAEARFTRAHFGQEVIIAGFGELVVVWQLLEVLKGKTGNYRLLSGEEQLRQCQFLCNDRKKLIMVSESKVRLQNL